LIVPVYDTEDVLYRIRFTPRQSSLSQANEPLFPHGQAKLIAVGDVLASPNRTKTLQQFKQFFRFVDYSPRARFGNGFA
jgi:hypothetical protein